LKQVKAKVLSNIEILRYRGIQYFLMELFADQIANQAKPGQFIMIGCGEDALLRRPVSIHSVLPNYTIQLLYACSSNNASAQNTALARETEIRVSRGIGTNWLSKLIKDAELDIIGPLGNGFTIDDEAKSVLLVAGGIGIAPLKFLAETALALQK
jgi:dihydroorotate dehydrogenase electron transfer subunit